MEEVNLEIKIDNNNPSSGTFTFKGEDHTLGNSLRYVLTKNPDVDFAGYSIPHPSENKFNLRIQTLGGITAYEALHKGLTDIQEISEHIQSVFLSEVNNYVNQMETE
eukprot:TRINITY_DN1832_c0_g1_i2.p1 TRINITY_DN1832_c0_g1~~TRINITY_DN1832_c0_g1_i2.p1  ORF type:complete len:107 (+),score=17.78 TRINITY_DN1832_c0_g1_i2:90-410(+)